MAGYSGVGAGTGYLNTYLNAEKFQTQQPGVAYDPNQYLNPNQILQMGQQQQQGYLSQSFNQQNPRMALPQNVGAALGGAVTRALTPTQAGNPQQGTQQDPANQIEQEFYKRAGQEADSMRAAGQPVNPLKAQWNAASSLIGDPVFGQSSIAQSFAAQQIDRINKLWNPNMQATADASTAQKGASTAQAQEATIETKQKVQTQREADSMVPIKWKAMGNNTFPVQVGPIVPRYVDSDDLTLNEDPNFKSNLTATQNATSADQMIPYSVFNASRNAQAANAQTTAVIKIQTAAATKDAADSNVDLDSAKKAGHMLAIGEDPATVMQMFGATGNNNSARNMARAISKYADIESGGTWSPTDAKVGLANEKAWDTGTVGQNFNRIQTVPSHFNEIYDAIKQLGNNPNTPTPATAYFQKAQQLFDPSGSKVPAFELAKDLAFTELNAALSPRGGADAALDRLLQNVKASDKPATLQAAMDRVVGFWQDKAHDAQMNYAQQVPRKDFLSDKLVDPQAVEMLTRKYPVTVGTGAKAKLQFDRLPDQAWVTAPDGNTAQASDFRAKMTSSQ